MLHKDHFTDLYDSVKAYNNLDKTGCSVFSFVSAVRLYA